MDTKTVIRILTDLTGLIRSTGGIHDLLVKYPDQAASLVDVMSNLAEGKSAIEAAEQAAPQLTSSIRLLARSIFTLNASTKSADHLAENFLRSLGGLGRMTPEQELAWMDRTSAQISDSRSGSG